jgi:hypothetical protein
MGACCTPSSGQPSPALDFGLPFTPRQRDIRDVARGMVQIAGGEFRMGGVDPDAFPDDGEGPVRTVRLSPYLIDATAVTNRQFGRFVKDTGYVTDAERFGWSFVFHLFVGPEQREHVRDATVPTAPWWLAVERACWRAPEGPKSNVAIRPNHPVGMDRRLVEHHLARRRLPGDADRPKGSTYRRRPSHPRRQLPVPPVLLQPLPCRRPHCQHHGQLNRQRRFPLRCGHPVISWLGAITRRADG